MKIIKKIILFLLCLLWAFVAALLVAFCIVLGPTSKLMIFFVAFIIVSLVFLIVILNKLRKDDRINLSTPAQTSKFLGIKTAMWISGVLCSTFLILTIWSVIFPSVGEWAGIEFVILVPGIILLLIIELPFLIFLLMKKNKQAIALSIIQCLLLLFLLFWVYIWDSFLWMYF